MPPPSCLAPWHPRMMLLPPVSPQILERFGALPALLLSPYPDLYSSTPREGRGQHPPCWGLSKTPPILPVPSARTLSSQGRNSPGRAPIILPTAICNFI